MVGIRIAFREPPAGGNAAAGIVLNGLAREARNLQRVGAYGYSARYQENAYVSMQNKWARICANLGGTAEVKAFVPFRG